MKFVMVTTFHGAESFGGDAAYVDRLATALLRAGHEVHVVHCADAFAAVRGRVAPRAYDPPPGLVTHRLKSPWGVLSPILTQLTGKAWLKRRALREVLEAPDVDVVHFHNVSLVGGAEVLTMAPHAVRIMTSHEHWLVCPMHLLWKNDRATCERPQCTSCSLKGGRPPQFWRAGGAIERGVAGLDALLYPSRHALVEHRLRGSKRTSLHLPYFLPDGWPGPTVAPSPQNERPYLAMAGRLVKMKGMQRVVPLMRWLPEADLKIAGSGPYEGALRKLAKGLPNVQFTGPLGPGALAGLFAGARGVVVPSLFPETFGYVVLEAFAMRTPVIVHRGGGAIYETGALSGGGLDYSDEGELLSAMRRIVHDDLLREKLASRGLHVRETAWSERSHIEAYLGLIGRLQEARPGRVPHQRGTARTERRSWA